MSEEIAFEWQGAADRVAVAHGVVGLPEPLRMRRRRGTDVFRTTVQLPRGSRVEYRILVQRGHRTESLLDPRNELVAYGPAGEMSFVTAAGHVTPWWSAASRGAPLGTVQDIAFESAVLQRAARMSLYLPAGSEDGGALPLVVLHDGSDFVRYAALTTVLDNLIDVAAMAPCAVAAVDPGDRLVEYGADPRHARFLADEVVAQVRERVALLPAAEGLVFAGASFGAVASLAAAAELGGGLRGLLLQSASLRTWVPEHNPARAAFEPVLRFVQSLRGSPPRVAARIFQSYGAFERLAASNREITPVLRRMAGETVSVATLDGHNWTSWRNVLGDGLVWLLPGARAAAWRAAAMEEGRGA